MIHLNFPEILKKLRTEHQLTQKEVANELFYGYTTISSYESGRNEPNIKDLISLAHFFEISVDYLIGASTAKYCTVPEVPAIIETFVNTYFESDKRCRQLLENILLSIFELYQNNQAEKIKSIRNHKI